MDTAEFILFKILYKLSNKEKATKKTLTVPLSHRFRAKDWDPAFELGLQKKWITQEVITPIAGKSRPTTIYTITKLGLKELDKKQDEYSKLF